MEASKQINFQAKQEANKQSEIETARMFMAMKISRKKKEPTEQKQKKQKAVVIEQFQKRFDEISQTREIKNISLFNQLMSAKKWQEKNNEEFMEQYDLRLQNKKASYSTRKYCEKVLKDCPETDDQTNTSQSNNPEDV